jgi:hypothetical protein
MKNLLFKLSILLFGFKKPDWNKMIDYPKTSDNSLYNHLITAEDTAFRLGFRDYPKNLEESEELHNIFLWVAEKVVKEYLKRECNLIQRYQIKFICRDVDCIADFISTTYVRRYIINLKLTKLNIESYKTEVRRKDIEEKIADMEKRGVILVQKYGTLHEESKKLIYPNKEEIK